MLRPSSPTRAARGRCRWSPLRCTSPGWPCAPPGASRCHCDRPYAHTTNLALRQNRGGAETTPPPCTLCGRPPPLQEANTPAAITNATLQERVRLFWRLAVPYFEQADGAKLNFGLMLLLVLVNSGISVIFSFVGRDFYSALSAKDQALFLEKTANFAVGLAVATPLTVLYKFQRQRLALNWREWMTTELARQYYADQAYYKIEIDRDLDNPDQRICEDVTAFTRVSLDFFITLMTSGIDLVSFSGILYSIYPQALLRAHHSPLTPLCLRHPHPQLFYAIFAYAGGGSLTTVYVGQRSSARMPSSCSARPTCATRSCGCARMPSASPSTRARRRRRRRCRAGWAAPSRTGARSSARSATSSSSRRRTRTSCRSCRSSSSRRSTLRARRARRHHPVDRRLQQRAQRPLHHRQPVRGRSRRSPRASAASPPSSSGWRGTGGTRLGGSRPDAGDPPLLRLRPARRRRTRPFCSSEEHLARGATPPQAQAAVAVAVVRYGTRGRRSTRPGKAPTPTPTTDGDGGTAFGRPSATAAPAAAAAVAARRRQRRRRRGGRRRAATGGYPQRQLDEIPGGGASSRCATSAC